MKTIFFITTLMVGSIAFAQTKPVDKMESTQIKTETVNENGKMVEKKVKIVTKKEQEVKTAPLKSGEIDAPMIETPTKITKTISVDPDNDDRFEEISEITYYTYNDRSYGFKSTNSGFVMSLTSNEAERVFGTARRTQNDEIYVITMNDYSGVGYFNQNNDFVIEYFDKDKGLMQQRSFKQTQF
ncbi:hypothetical protein ES677_13475 [Bizionia gelidisalsuginis]|uniref:Uncharacterized protein n=1 Tax=Bizionia gelidisalsuginis TaxID=291188 RepID=A0ABY3M7K0_9FLAO|nr:hypothetical protein [Bizionia gelidisalsuginis]TYC09168.1 hypothetical protein ES677_13475 [Bizionia gelidisalsuginis]